MMPQKLSRRAVAGDLAEVEAMLRSRPDQGDTIAMLWRSRAEALRQELANIESAEPSLASVALIFNGLPVVASEEIRVDFATKALDQYQALVSAVFADVLGADLGAKGRIPHAHRSKLYIRDIVHGSMGFILDERSPAQPELLPSPLKDSVERSTEILAALSDPARFDQTVDELKPRIVDAVKAWTRTLRKFGAEMKVVADRGEISLDHDEIDALDERLNDVQVVEDEHFATGVLNGVLPEHETFEFTPDEASVALSGTISDALAERYAVAASEMVQRHGRGQFLLIRTFRGGTLKKEQRILQAFTPDVP